MSFRRLAGLTLAILVVCNAAGCDRLRDEDYLTDIRRCGVKARSVSGDRIQVDFLDGQGDAELRCISSHLRKLTQTTHLLLNNSKVTDAGLASLTGLNNVNMIMLDHTGITDAGLTNLNTMTGLQILGLTGTQVTDAGIKKLKHALPGLEIEKLTAPEERAVEQIEDINNRLIHPTSESIIWWGTGKPIGMRLDKVSDTDLLRLREHVEALNEHLQEMVLSGGGLTDLGLNYLKGLSHLQRLTLIGTGVTDAGVRQVHKALPRLEVLRLPAGAQVPTALPPP
jgi:hypothetical protein